MNLHAQVWILSGLIFSRLHMFALLEIARIYKALNRFADLQGPICHNDAQNKEMNLIVY